VLRLASRLAAVHRIAIGRPPLAFWLILAPLCIALLIQLTTYVAPLVWPLLSDDFYSLRNPGYPQVYIEAIHVDVTSSCQCVTLTWSNASLSRGPFRCSTGKGLGYNDCNDPVESNCIGSECTPKGEHVVKHISTEGDPRYPYQHHVVLDLRRAISIHPHNYVPRYPVSQGCIRMLPRDAKYIHNNCISGLSKVVISGEWSSPSAEPRVYYHAGKSM
jgi:hypothetical protein